MAFTSFLLWVSSTLHDMGVPSWYSFISGSILVTWLLLLAIYRAFTSEWRSTSSFILNHLVYPHIFPRLPFIGTATRFEVLIAFLYFLVNTLVVMIGTRAERGTRAAIMSTINLIPLLCGPRLSLVTKLLGIPLRASIGSHQWFARTAIAQMSFHIVMLLTGSNKFVWTAVNLTGVVAGSTFGLILLLSIRIARRALYETFLNTHLLLSVVGFIVIWRHVSSRKPAEMFLHLGFGLWATASTLHWGYFAFRNLALGRSFATAVVMQPEARYNMDKALVRPSEVFQVDVTVPRPWTVKPGQFIFLSIPKLGVLTGFRGHPFMVTWWERDQKGLKISLLVKSRAGFTAELSRHLNKDLLAFIDGPYSADHGFGEYGTVIMFATGIGIAGHIPYIKDLIRGYNDCTVKTRRIRVLWQIKESGERSLS